MAVYVFEINDNNGELITLQLDDGILVDDWRTKNPPTKLLVESGGVNDDRPDKLICVRDGATIVELIGANWDSEIGDTGAANCEGCDAGCDPSQTWMLAEKS